MLWIEVTSKWLAISSTEVVRGLGEVEGVGVGMVFAFSIEVIDEGVIGLVGGVVVEGVDRRASWRALALARRRNFRAWSCGVVEGIGVGVAGVSIKVVEGVGKGVSGGMGVVGKGMGVAGVSIEVVEGVGKGVGDGVGVVGKGMGIGAGASFRLLLGLRSFLLWPCCLLGPSVGVLMGSREWGLEGGW